MKTIWLHRNKTEQLVVFYSGWGMDENTVKHLEPGGSDICVCFDYRSIPDEIPKEWHQYSNITVIGWSLGITAARIHLSEHQLPITHTIAINGTLIPIDDLYGIPEDIYWKTLHGLTEQTRDKFFLRMCGNRMIYKRFQSIQPNRDIDDLAEELISLAHYSLETQCQPITWTHVVIGNQDRIFLPKNQQNYWKTTQPLIISEMDLGHFPFFTWTSWKELIFSTLGSKQN